MAATHIYQLDEWHDFFLTVGAAGAVLTGLVFVALSINLSDVTQDATHRYRAIGTTTGFMSAFVISSLALMGGQGYVAVGIEWAVVATIAAGVYVFGYVQAVRTGESDVGLGAARLAAGTALFIVEIVGASVLVAGHVAGLYIAAVAMLTLVVWMISGAWLLIVGVSPRSSERENAD